MTFGLKKLSTLVWGNAQILITKVPEVVFETSKRQAGIAINYSSKLTKRGYCKNND
jgi:hypothetical protein